MRLQVTENHDHDDHNIEVIHTYVDNPLEKTTVAVCHTCPPTPAERDHGMLRHFNLRSTYLIDDDEDYDHPTIAEGTTPLDYL